MSPQPGKTETQPIKAPKPRRIPPAALYTILFVLIVAAIFVIVRLVGPHRPSGNLKQMEETVVQIQKLETDIQQRQNEVFTLMGDYKKQTGKDLTGITGINLTPDQKKLLEEKIRGEKEVSVQSMLQDILDKNQEIGQMQERVQQLEALLPRPHLVEKGENHYQIAMNFLLNEKGIPKKQAMKLIERTALFEPLIPGFKVWNFYSGEEYGTFVTQGSAAISPNQIQRRVKQELVDARDQAVSARDRLQIEIKELESRRAELVNQLDLLNQEKNAMLNTIGQLNDQNKTLETSVNSLHYILDSRRNLEKKQILKRGFLRAPKLQSLPPEAFTLAIDLRQTTRIEIKAASLGLSRIRDVVLYPNFLRRGQEYEVEIAKDNQSATLIVRDSKKLRNEQVVIAVE